jgi:hypothetical protein
MALSHSDRFKLKSQLLETLGSDAWAFEKRNLLLGEFGLPLLEDVWDGPSMPDILISADDGVLVEMYALAFGISAEEVEDAVESAALRRELANGIRPRLHLACR